ncbi:ABC transporter ATP-binding protein [Streptococcus ovuberis]|uniref:ABC transporter ATP-binding protein n=1 Tax=Streptococcus ovuberis TaxID=1936207 RepID=A0A7X6S265_9STRE|nr:ABC transporter ATP-binding protein [Streptococcus ovuberis]NKZ20926.1 ABC transporter ATP-binding protein [Streptococcus ovuberis]
MSPNQKSLPVLPRLLNLLIRNKVILGLVLIGTLVQVGLTVYLPVLIGRFLDSVLLQDTLSVTARLLAQMALVIGANTLLQWLLPLAYNRLVYGAVADLRQKVLSRLHQLPFSYLDKQSVGDLVSRVTSDSEQLTNGLLMVFNQLFIGLLTILLTVVSMARLDLLMVLLVIVLTPISLLIAKFIAQRSYKLYQAQTQSRGEVMQLLEESIAQHSLIQTLSAQEQQIMAFKGLNRAYSQNSQQAIFYASTVNPVTRFINALIYALLAAVGAIRIMRGQFTVGQLTTFLNYANQYSKPFNDISSGFAEWQSALACAERLFEITDSPRAVDYGQEVLRADQVSGQLSFDQVSFGYAPDKILLKDLTLEIPAGSKVAIVGPTGAGKSTLINLLMRFYELDRGQIVLDGIPINRYSKESFRDQIGMVLQETWLKAATVHDNIAYGKPQASRKEVEKAAREANADFFIQQLPNGYDTYLTDGGSSLSQGQAQLLAISRVFLKAPKLLILDEATSSIDTRTELLVQEAFERLMKGRTSFIIAHRLSTIETADIILVMVAGQIIEWGTHDQLMMQRGFYYRMQMGET